MIEDLPEPEETPTNTKVKTEFVTIEFDDQGTAKVTLGTVKGYLDGGEFKRDERTREKVYCDKLDIDADSGPRKIVSAVKAEMASRREKADLETNPMELENGTDADDQRP